MDMLSSYRVYMATVGGREVMKEMFAGLKEPIVHYYKMDEEWEYKAPGNIAFVYITQSHEPL